ncbi:hypothetical protein [Pseudomonas savastanoi]|uniref:hypothetical protein n=1 Tax=Pseudomonas savastanoi TaxID=29438 RepID=UPI001787253C|nr:hypothetical protein [Pseudomonas savastanoi]QOI07871.1 hypothetical protein D5S10_29520 [Pseudomonas savastanoi]
MKIGAIFFDSANSSLGSAGNSSALGNGWASIAGSSPVRVQSIHDLPTDTIWLTNLTYSSLCQTRLNEHPNFRSDAWLKTPIKQLVAELGVDCEHSPVDTACVVVSTLAHRVVDVSNVNYGVQPRSASLATDFAEAIKAPVTDIPDELAPVIDPIAGHPAVSIIRPSGGLESTASVLLRKNRLFHADRVLSTLVPAGGAWLKEKTSTLEGQHQWLEQVNTPFLVECSISNLDPITAEILSWGSGSSTPRNWLTNIEWNVVRQFSDIKIGRVYIYSEEGRVVDQHKLLPQGPHAPLSMTNCLIAEQLWCSLLLKRPAYAMKSNYTAAAAWLRSTDRMEMFEYAKLLYAAGLDVIRYGNGNVIVNYQNGGLARIMDVATDLGLMPPTSKFLEVARPGGA